MLHKKKGSRFEQTSEIGQIMRMLFLSGTELEAVQYLEEEIKPHKLTIGEVALRWLQHHSVLTPYDYVVIGASKLAHVSSNCVDSAKGPLPEDVVKACETAWLIAKGRSPPAFLSFN